MQYLFARVLKAFYLFFLIYAGNAARSLSDLDKQSVAHYRLSKNQHL